MFDLDNEQHLGFVTSVANILAVNYGVTEPPERSLIGHDHEFRNPDYIRVRLGLGAQGLGVEGRGKGYTEGSVSCGRNLSIAGSSL